MLFRRGTCEINNSITAPASTLSMASPRFCLLGACKGWGAHRGCVEHPQALMREQMRSTDRAMSNIESHPEGFNMLRRMYENVQVRRPPESRNFGVHFGGALGFRARPSGALPLASRASVRSAERKWRGDGGCRIRMLPVRRYPRFSRGRPSGRLSCSFSSAGAVDERGDR